MPPLSPPSVLSPGNFMHTSSKVRSVSKGPERPTWGEKVQDSESPSSTPQAPVRSALASINIVVACTSSLMITSALGSAVTISLPYMEKDLNIRKGDLQWILSAYSISSVSILCYNASPSLAYFTQACFLLLCGRLADLYGRKFVWLIGYFVTGTCGLSAPFARCMSDQTLHYFLSFF
jgi:MFS family permease